MRLVLFRTPDVDPDQFGQLLLMLDAVVGRIRIEGVEEVPALLHSTWREWNNGKARVNWDEAFTCMRDLRKAHGLEEQDALVLLTGMPNEADFFAFAEPLGEGPGNHCMHTDGWQGFVGMNFCFPVLHLIASNVVQGFIFNSMDDWEQAAHQESRGCISDMCMNKEDIMLRLRTADICGDCQTRFQDAIASKALDSAIFHQCMEWTELARNELLFHKRLAIAPLVSSLHVKGERLELWLADLQREIKLTPLRKSIYLLYLNHPEGIRYNDLGDHIDELIGYHARIKGSRTEPELREVFQKLFNPGDLSRLNQEVSKTRTAIKSAAGQLWNHYIWEPSAGEIKSIPLVSSGGEVVWERLLN